MKAEIIATGKEILSGDIIDTNSGLISEKLTGLGLNVIYLHCTGDNENQLSELLVESSKRSDLIVVSGGLGPTDDDRTRLAAAIASGSGLSLNKDALKSVKEFFRKRDLPMPDENITQAIIPEISTPIENLSGTAPGFFMELNRAKVYFFPGVPYELENLLNSFFLENIKEITGGKGHKYISRVYTVFGLPESEVGSLLSDFTDFLPLESEDTKLELGTQAVFPHIFVKIYARGRNESELKNRCDKAEEFILKKLKKYIISKNGQTLNEVCAGLLIKKGKTLSLAESCTGGLIGNLLTDVPGSSEFFKMSGVVYSNEAKSELLGVDAQTIKKYGAVSAETAIELADGARKKGDSDYGLSTTGIAGPGGAVPGKGVGTVYIGISSKNGSKSFRFERDFGQRLLNKKLFACVALQYLINEIKTD